MGWKTIPLPLKWALAGFIVSALFILLEIVLGLDRISETDVTLLSVLAFGLYIIVIVPIGFGLIGYSISFVRNRIESDTLRRTLTGTAIGVGFVFTYSLLIIIGCLLSGGSDCPVGPIPVLLIPIFLIAGVLGGVVGFIYAVIRKSMSRVFNRDDSSESASPSEVRITKG